MSQTQQTSLLDAIDDYCIASYANGTGGSIGEDILDQLNALTTTVGSLQCIVRASLLGWGLCLTVVCIQISDPSQTPEYFPCANPPYVDCSGTPLPGCSFNSIVVRIFQSIEEISGAHPLKGFYDVIGGPLLTKQQCAVSCTNATLYRFANNLLTIDALYVSMLALCGTLSSYSPRVHSVANATSIAGLVEPLLYCNFYLEKVDKVRSSSCKDIMCGFRRNCVAG